MVKKAAQALPNHLLRRARIERGWTQQHLADLIGAPLCLNITRWERGTAIPSAYYRRKLCEIFGLDVRELGLVVLEERESQPESENAVKGTLWNVPYRRNPFFTGREGVLFRLEQTLLKGESTVLPPFLALSGLGGIGKTQLAVEYAYRNREQYRAVFWVNAASRETLLADFNALAHLLSLSERDAQDHQRVVDAVQRWLTQNRQWLLILDNADELSMVENFLPRTGQGHVLLTTRSQATGKLAVCVAVEKMEPQESVLLLLRRGKWLPLGAPLSSLDARTLNQAQTLACMLDGLPLALSQAAAYLEESGCNLQEYLDLYRKHQIALLERASTVLPEYPSTVAKTWSLSLQKVEQAHPAAVDLLRLCAFLDADAIPEKMLSAGATLLGPKLGTALVDDLKRNETLRALRHYSLIRRDPEMKMLHMHRLVQAVIQAEMDKQIRRMWATNAVKTVHAALGEPIFENWTCFQECLPHALACARLVDAYHLDSAEAVQLLDRTGMYLQQHALYAEAVALLRSALRICEQGDNCSAIATILDHLALIYSDQGEYTEAQLLYQRALVIREGMLGEEHPDTATTLFNLDWLYYLQGKYSLAEQAAQRALSLREKVLGSEHWDTVDVSHDLALIYTAQGKYEPAESLLRHALGFYDRTVGQEHTMIAKTLHNLALLYTAWGKYEQAKQLFQRALVVHRKTVGPQHPNFAHTLTNLAHLYCLQGCYKRARVLNSYALTIFEKTVGSEHPDTATTLTNLAHLYHLQSCYEQAGPLYQRALEIREHKLGSQHPKIADTLYLLSCMYESQGQPVQAEVFCQRAMIIRERTLGPEHPDTKATQALYVRLSRMAKQMEAS